MRARVGFNVRVRFLFEVEFHAPVFEVRHAQVDCWACLRVALGGNEATLSRRGKNKTINLSSLRIRWGLVAIIFAAIVVAVEPDFK